MLTSSLLNISNAAPAAAEAALLKTAADVTDVAKQLCPVDTGNLKQSIGALPVSSQEVQVGTAVDYSVYVEYGTSRMGAQPFLTPAFLQSQSTFEARLVQEIEKLA